MLLACAAAVYAGLALFGISLTQAQADGWMFQPPSAAAFSPPWDFDAWRGFRWHLLPALSADFIAVMFVATVSILLNVAGLEVTAKREANLDRELTAAGIANLAAAAFGGYVTGVPLSRGRSRSSSREQPYSDPLRRGELRRDAGRQSRISRLCAEMRARRAAAQSRHRSALPLARRLIAAAVAHRISLAHRHHADDHQLGLRCRHPGRHRHQLRHLRAERQPGERGQVQLRRLGISQFARSRSEGARAARRNTAGNCRA